MGEPRRGGALPESVSEPRPRPPARSPRTAPGDREPSRCGVLGRGDASRIAPPPPLLRAGRGGCAETGSSDVSRAGRRLERTHVRGHVSQSSPVARPAGMPPLALTICSRTRSSLRPAPASRGPTPPASRPPSTLHDWHGRGLLGGGLGGRRRLRGRRRRGRRGRLRRRPDLVVVPSAPHDRPEQPGDDRPRSHYVACAPPSLTGDERERAQARGPRRSTHPPTLRGDGHPHLPAARRHPAL